MTIRVIKELMIELLTFLKKKQENEMIKMVSYQQRLVKASNQRVNERSIYIKNLVLQIVMVEAKFFKAGKFSTIW